MNSTKLLGLIYALTLSLALISAAPSPTFAEAISTISLVGADVVLAGASGATLATVPVASLLLGKALIVKKALLLKALADQQSQRRG